MPQSQSVSTTLRSTPLGRAGADGTSPSEHPMKTGCALTAAEARFEQQMQQRGPQETEELEQTWEVRWVVMGLSNIAVSRLTQTWEVRWIVMGLSNIAVSRLTQTWEVR